MDIMNKTNFEPCIYLEQDDIYVGLSHEQTLLEALLNQKIPIAHSCGGNGTCGTCLCTIDSKYELPEKDDLEKEMSEDRGFHKNERLACQIILKQECKLIKYNISE